LTEFVVPTISKGIVFCLCLKCICATYAVDREVFKTARFYCSLLCLPVALKKL
jgi:hypothetical protein